MEGMLYNFFCLHSIRCGCNEHQKLHMSDSAALMKLIQYFLYFPPIL